MRIGDLEIKGKTFLAPMAGVTNEAFRIICHEMGASLVYTEMVSDKALVYQNQKTIDMIKINPQEHPISIQIFGVDKETFVEAAKYVDQQTSADIIDINMGCPAPKIAIKSQAGAALLKNPDAIYETVKAVVESVKKPVTIKMRLGWDENSINCVEIAKLVEKAGVKAIALHARTRNQFYTGTANWEWIKKVKQAVNIPVIGNGDIFSCIDAKRMIEEANCDGVMIARAAQGNPWIFREVEHYLETGEMIGEPDINEWRDVIFRHAELLVDIKSEHIAISEMRKNLVFYFKGKPNAASYKVQAVKIETLEDLKNIVNNYVDDYNKQERG